MGNQTMPAARLQRCSSLAGALRSASQRNCSLRTQSRISYQFTKRRILLKSCKISRATPAKKLPTKYPLRRSPRYLRRSLRLQDKQGDITLKARIHPASSENPASSERGIEALLPCPKKAKIVLPRDESGFHGSETTVTGQNDASLIQECAVYITTKDQCPEMPWSASAERLNSDEGNKFETNNCSPKAPALPPRVNLDGTIPIHPLEEYPQGSSVGSPLCPALASEVAPIRSATPTLSLTRTHTCTFSDPSL